MRRLAVITTHPIQYYAPWFRYLISETLLQLKVFYLWDFGVTRQQDAGFRQPIQWDIPLLAGYEYEFVPNSSTDPGTHHFWGLHNPSLLQQVRTYNPDAVLLMTYNYASVYHFLWQWNGRKAPLLFRGDSHRLVPSTGLKELVRRNIISQIFRRFSAFLYVGEANRNYFCYHHVSAQKLFFAPHAVDNDRFFVEAERAARQASDWKSVLGIPEDHAVILFAGKFEPKKRPLDLLQAFIQANLSQVSLLFVGSGPLEKELRRQAGAHPHIYFAPFQNQSLMPRTYAVADLVVLPSYGSGETWGLAINEAMCMSRPVIVSTHVGCAQDLVHSYRNGLVFPAADIRALSNCLREAFSNRERLRQWGAESRRIIADYSYLQATQGLTESLSYLNISQS